MLAAIGIVIVAQFAFTYAPFMHVLFESAPFSIVDGSIIIGVGIALMVVLEIEKVLMPRLFGDFAPVHTPARARDGVHRRHDVPEV